MHLRASSPSRSAGGLRALVERLRPLPKELRGAGDGHPGRALEPLLNAAAPGGAWRLAGTGLAVSGHGPQGWRLQALDTATAAVLDDTGLGARSFLSREQALD